MSVPSLGGIKKQYNKSDKAVKDYFGDLPKLMDKFDYSISVAYLFLKVEYAHTLALYYRLLQLKVDKTLSDKAVNNTNITRSNFADFFEEVFGEELNKKAVASIKAAEKIRDKIMHGKDDFKSKDMREAIPAILKYAELFNKQIKDKVGFQPFSNEQKTRSRNALDKETSRWVLKGMGFNIK